ncbi:MAG: histidine phosphotransferase family protein [Bacteroidota bacterium]
MSGPVGAAAAGAELLEDMGAASDAETLELVAGAATGAAQRLKFFRAALGPAASTPQSTVALSELVQAYLSTQVSAASPGIVLSWPGAPGALDGATARLLLNLVLLAKDALPRGGRLRVDCADGAPVVIAHGEPAALTEEARHVLVEGNPPSGPRGAQAEFTRILAERAGGRLSVAVTPDGLALTLGGAASALSRSDG